MQQINIIPEIQRLCSIGSYDTAIELTDKIENKEIAVKAHLLCMEHEERSRINAQNKG